MTKATGAARGVRQFIDLDQLNIGDRLKYDLRDTLPFGNLERTTFTCGMKMSKVSVLHDDTDFSSIVGVDCAEDSGEPFR